MAACRGFLDEEELVFLQRRDALLVGCDHRIGLSLDDAVEQNCDILVDALHIFLARPRNRSALRQTLLPRALEHRARQIEQALGRREQFQHRRERAFDLLALDRFAVAHATLAEAHVVRMLLAGMTSRPIACQRLAATMTGDAAAQRKVCADVGACRRLRAFVQALLNALMGFEIDQRRVAAFAQRDVPFRGLDIACVQCACQHVVYLLKAHLTRAVFRESGIGLEETQDFALRAEPA